MEPFLVDESVDKIARALFDRWTRSPVIEFSENIEDAIFLEAATRGANLTGNQVADMTSTEIMKLHAVVAEYKDLLSQFLLNLDKPEYAGVWTELAGARAGVKGTRNKARDGGPVTAKNFLTKFTTKAAAKPVPKPKPAPVPVPNPSAPRPPQAPLPQSSAPLVFEGVDPFSGLMDDVFPFDVSAMDDAIGPSLLSKGAGPAADDILASAKNRLLAAPPAPAQPQAPPPATAVAFASPSAPTAASFTTAAGGPSTSAFAQDDLDDLLSGGGTGGNVAKYDELDLDDLSVIGFGSAEADAQAGLDDLFDDLPSTPAASTSAAGAGSSDAK